MKENAVKGVLAVFITGLSIYFRNILAPLIVLGIVMIIDYITGIAEAWASSSLSSRVGILGIIKKLGYLVAVVVAGVVDYLIQLGAAGAGQDLRGFFGFGLLVTIWLILNECISILENLSEIGVPLPGFLVAIVKKLKKTAEEQGEEQVKKELGLEQSLPEHPPDEK